MRTSSLIILLCNNCIPEALQHTYINRPFLHKDFGCPEACLMAAPSGCSVFPALSKLQKVVNWSHILCFLSKIEPSQLHLCTWQPGFPYAKRAYWCHRASISRSDPLYTTISCFASCSTIIIILLQRSKVTQLSEIHCAEITS